MHCYMALLANISARNTRPKEEKETKKTCKQKIRNILGSTKGKEKQNSYKESEKDGTLVEKRSKRERQTDRQTTEQGRERKNVIQ